MSAWAIRLAATAVSLVGLLAVAMVPSQAQSLDELHVQARAEGGLVLYVGGPTAPWDARAKQFEQRYSGIKVSITGGFSNVLDKQIDQQLKRTSSQLTPLSFRHSTTSSLEGGRPAHRVQTERHRRHRCELQGR